MQHRVEHRPILNPERPRPPSKPDHSSSFQNNYDTETRKAVTHLPEERQQYLQSSRTPVNPPRYTTRPNFPRPQPPPFLARPPGPFEQQRYLPPKATPANPASEARFNYNDFQNRPQRSPQISPWTRVRQILPSVRAGTPQSVISQIIRTEAPPVLFDKMAPVLVSDDREWEMKMGIRRDSIIRSPQPGSRKPLVMMPAHARNEFSEPRFSTTAETENSVRRQSQILAEAAVRTFKDPASLHPTSEYSREGRSGDIYESRNRFTSGSSRMGGPYDQRPPGYYPNYHFDISDAIGGNRSQQNLVERNVPGRNGLWNDSSGFVSNLRNSSLYQDTGINGMLNGRNTSAPHEAANVDKNEKKFTPNGDIKPPSSLPSELKKEKSLLKTPTKKISPKSPDRNAANSVAEKKKIPMNKIQVGAAPSPNLREVKSKVGSLDNYTHKPGGGKVKIENRKLEWNAQPRIEAKNENWTPPSGTKKIPQVKLQWNAKSKIGSLENATHKPGGGDKRIETIKLDFKDKAKPKVGSKDNIKHVPGGGYVKKTDADAKSVSSDIEDQKLEFKAQSKVGSLDNVKHRPGGGDKKIFDDKEYLRQMAALSENSKINSATTSGSQSPSHL